jgi:hypothetical protein
MHEMYIVSATKTLAAAIYDISGNTLARSAKYSEWARATLCMGKRLFEIDFQVRKAHEIERKYASRVRIEWHAEEDWFTLESLDPALSVAAIISEFGLVPKVDYHRRCSTTNDTKRRP